MEEIDSKEKELEIERQFQQGNKDAWRALFDRHHRILVKHIRNLPWMSFQVDADHLALDIASDAFIKAWDAHDTFDPKRWRWSTWLYRIAENQSIDTLRLRNRHRGEGNCDLNPKEDEGDDGDDSISLLSGLDIGFNFGPGEEMFVPTTSAEKLDAFYAKEERRLMHSGRPKPSEHPRLVWYRDNGYNRGLVPLSKRERVIVDEAMTFTPRKEIAKKLGMSTAAFDMAISRIRKKIIGNC